MGAKIIDGKAIADKIRIELQEELKNLKADGVEPGIATLLVGDDFGAKMYRKAVERFCGEMGFAYREETLSLIHISEPTRRTPISYAVFCLKKKKKPHDNFNNHFC